MCVCVCEHLGGRVGGCAHDLGEEEARARVCVCVCVCACASANQLPPTTATGTPHKPTAHTLPHKPTAQPYPTSPQHNLPHKPTQQNPDLVGHSSFFPRFDALQLFITLQE